MLNRLSLNKLSLNRVDLNRIGGRDVGVSGRPYIDPELLSHVKMAISTWGKTNDDPDRAVLKDLTPNGNDMRLLNFGFAGNSGYGLYGADFTTWTKSNKVTSVDYKSFNFDTSDSWVLLYHKSNLGKDTPSFKVYINADGALYYNYINQEGILKSIAIKSEDFETPVSYNTLYMGETPVNIGFTTSGACKGSITQLPDFEGWLCTDGVEDMIESVKPVSEMLEGSNEITVVSIIHQISTPNTNNYTNVIRTEAASSGISILVGKDVGNDKTGIYGYTIKEGTATIINSILGDKNDYTLKFGKIEANIDSKFFVQGWQLNGDYRELSSVAYAGGFIANKSITIDEINQVIAYYNLDRPGQIIKPQLYCNIKKQGITNENHAEFNNQLIDFVGGHNIQLNNIGWEGESGIIDGALYLDGINDFGKVTDLPVLKDYTICALRKWLYGDSATSVETGSIVSKSKANQGAFILEQTLSLNPTRCGTWNFGTFNALTSDDKLNEESFTYQTKYSYNGETIVSGSGVDGDSMWLGTIRDGDARFSKLALWSLMLFPYSLSEFLLERQLGKYKAGTLYPDMIEFRPVIKSNVPYSSVSYSVNPGEYIAEGSTVTITITLSNASDKLIGVSSNAISDISIAGNNGAYEITGKVTKSPQKISIVISSYLTMLGNETLISNETLIKNE